MLSGLRFIRLMAIVLWVGGLLFFAFVLAPVAFHVLPTTHEAGLVVGGTLIYLHRIGFVCGALFLGATGLLWASKEAPGKTVCMVQMVLIAFMLGVTLYLQNSVLPAMERDRAATGGDVDAASRDNPSRLDFERLHPLSERFEGAALFAGLGVVALLSLERTSAKTVHS